MTRRVIYTRPDGGVSVVIPTQETLDRFPVEADLDAHLLDRSIPADASAVQFIDHTDLPTDRTFRNAWRRDLGAVVVDMPLARDIQMAHIRAARDDALAASDTDMIRAQEDGDPANVLKVRRQALRDMPANIQTQIDNAPNPTALKSTWPANLARPA